MKKQVIQSSDTNVRKYIFEKDDIAVEAVLYRYPTFEERTVICCSVQCGCPVGCTFCGTGKFFKRNLTHTEIIEQVTRILEDVVREETDRLQKDFHTNQIQKLQIMFMSMGEPFLNYRNLEEAIIQLNNRYPNAALLVSTSSPKVLISNPDLFDSFISLSKTIHNIGLQFSVHESTDESRRLLIPTATCDLVQIAMLGNRWAGEVLRAPFFNYCVHDRNNTEEDASRLLKLFDPLIWECTLSVICERDESVKSAHEKKLSLVQHFSDIMTKNNFSLRIFNPAGQDDIGGGCGMLFYFQRWANLNCKKP